MGAKIVGEQAFSSRMCAVDDRAFVREGIKAVLPPHGCQRGRALLRTDKPKGEGDRQRWSNGFLKGRWLK